MKASRNDPCPCGSGKKYKACCMARDEARARARSVLGEEAFDQVEAATLAAGRRAEAWEADVAPAPGGIRENPDAGLSLVMVAAGGFVLHGDVVPRRPVGAGERAREIAAAVNAAGRMAGVLPARVRVPDGGLAEALGRELAGRGITVEAGDSEALFDAMNAALANLDPGPAAGRMTLALTWRETEASARELAEFHEAAAAFYTAAPWAMEESSFLLDLPREEEPPGLNLRERGPWAASLMGALGESFGVALYSRPGDLAGILMADDPLEAALEGTGFSVTVDFDRRSELTRAMQREITAAGWPIAGPRAYPRLFGMHLPGRRVLAHEVRVATLALRAMALHARGGDALAEAGVRVEPFQFEEEEEEESREDWFRFPDEAQPICPEGPGAEPEAGLRAWDTDEAELAVQAAEAERCGRLLRWLEGQGRSAIEMEADRQNAEHWTDFLGRILPAGAVTEFDLRLFLYSHYPRKAGATIGAMGELPRSMRLIFRFLAEQEGIRYPFAAGVLDELDGIAARGRELDEPLEQTLRILSYDVYEDLESRAVRASSHGWPDLMAVEVAQLRDELQRRWLLWYDELVWGGMTDFGDLEDALLARQREWQTTPHPRVDGRTPFEVVAASLR